MLNPKHNVHIFSDKVALDHAAVDYWLRQAQLAIEERGSFHVALTGGSSPQAMYRLLADGEYKDRVDWQRVHIYIGDERFVPHDHPDSNYGMARNCFLDHVAIPDANLHPILTEGMEPVQSAEQYASALQLSIPSNVGHLPQFDLIMLGMGDDGHTASLFPDTDILAVKDKTVAAVYVDKLTTWRVSLTYSVLNAARQIMFIVCGVNKADILAHVLKQGSDHIYPVQGVNSLGDMHWFLDQAAASKLD